MNLLMQVRNSGEKDRKEEGNDASGRDNRAQGSFAVREPQAHSAASLRSSHDLRKSDLSLVNWTPPPEWLTDATQG